MISPFTLVECIAIEIINAGDATEIQRISRLKTTCPVKFVVQQAISFIIVSYFLFEY